MNEIFCTFHRGENPSAPGEDGEDGGQRHVLGRVVLGGRTLPPALHDGVPVVQVHMASPGFDSATEVWTTDRPALGGEHQGLTYAHDGEYFFCAGTIAPSGTYRDQARAIYDAAFRLTDELGYRHIFRMWNFIGDLNADNAEGLEVYRDFCVGRAEAFEARPDRVDCMPAATGIGSRSPGVSFYFLASRTGEVEHFENPLQVPAYRYPVQYGPKPPSFARATRLIPEGSGRGAVYVSGTASITGHTTRHAGDITAQCALSLDNIRELIGPNHTARSGPPGGWELKDLRWVKAYVRHEEHLPAVRAACAEAFPPETEVVYLNVDICRSDLLVEIEGVVPA